MKSKNIFIVAFLICCIAYYYFFLSTLMFSEVIGKTKSARANIFINLLDFDTGLTRFDLYRLSKKSDYWNMRMRNVRSIRDINRRKVEEEKLTAEMMEDPAIKKITRKLLGFSANSSMAILEAAASFRSFGLF